MSKNKNLNKAAKAKNDEFYTRLEDIENELQYYTHHFKDKVVYCNCDNPEWSNFWKYFSDNFQALGLKKLISSHYERDKPSYSLAMTADLAVSKTQLTENGDFRSPECIKLLKEADIVVTNPPFSLFRQYVAQLVAHDKSFLILGNQNAFTYKEIFKLIKAKRLFLACVNRVGKFVKRDGSLQGFGNISWFTDMPHNGPKKELILTKTYKGNEKDYPKYDNYDAIEVSKVKDIPFDYEGVMGVPITFLYYLDSTYARLLGTNRGVDQDPSGVYGRSSYVNDKETFKRLFIIIGATESEGKGFSEGLWDAASKVAQPLICGKRGYKRLFIKNKKPQDSK